MMTNKFLEYNKSILEKSNLSIGYHETREEEIIEKKNNKEFIRSRQRLVIQEFIEIRPIELNECPALAASCIFGMFDIYIDRAYKVCRGKNFTGKYYAIKDDSNIMIMEKLFYRIIKLIRNAIIHEPNEITTQDHVYLLEKHKVLIKKTLVKYELTSKKYGTTEFELDISNELLFTLYNAIMIVIDESIALKRGDKFKEGLLAYYYYKLKEGVKIRDDIHRSKDKKIKIPSKFDKSIIALNPKRKIITNPQYSILKDSIEIKNAKILEDNGRDFLLKYKEACYIIPKEVLVNGIILLTKLDEWKVDQAYLSYIKE